MCILLVTVIFYPTVWSIFEMPYRIALSSLRPLIALNPKSIAFISVIFVLIVLFDYIFNLFFLGGGHVSADFCLWVLVTPSASCFYVLFMSLFSNFLFVFCDLVYLINLIWFDLITVGDHSFAAAGPRLWNSVWEDITSEPSLLVFRRKLKLICFSKIAHCAVSNIIL